MNREEILSKLLGRTWWRLAAKDRQDIVDTLLAEEHSVLNSVVGAAITISASQLEEEG